MSTVFGALALAVAVIGATAAQVIGTYQRAPWCQCGHSPELHHHDRHGTDCAKCACPELQVPVIRRDSLL